MTSLDTMYSEREALLSSPNSSVYYESFPYFLDQRHLGNFDVSSESGSRIKVWISNKFRMTSAWCLGRVNQSKFSRSKNLSPAFGNAVAVCVVGIAAALVAYIVDMAESHIFDWKYGFCTTRWTASKSICCSGYTDCLSWQTWSAASGIDNDKFSIFNFFLYLACVLLLSSLSYILTWYTRVDNNHQYSSVSSQRAEKKAFPQYFAAAGSGVLEVKQSLMGSQAKAPWWVSTLVIKTIALVMSTSSGLNVGKEGPYVHLSASVANLVNNSLGPFLGLSSRRALSIGSAAGLTSAFGAPISGAVFVMEGLGLRLSSFSFSLFLGGGLIAAVTLKALNPYGGNTTMPFDVRYTTSWEYHELPIFFAVGAAGGVLGALFTGSVRLWSSSYRQLYLVRRYPFIDVLIVAVVTALTSFWSKYLRLGAAELLSLLTTPYIHTSSSQAAGLKGSPAEAVADTVDSLGSSLLIKFALTVITFGLPIPQGIYIPSMAIGAIMGRCIGQSAHILHHGSTSFRYGPNIEPAVYTMAGAGALLAGVTRLHFTVVVIVFELTRSWDYIVPFALAIYIAKALATYLEPQGIYDLVADIQGDRSLDAILNTSDTRIEDCLEALNSQTPAVNLSSEYVTQGHILKTVLDSTEATGVHALPILKGTRFVGCVSTYDFRKTLASLNDYLHVSLDYESTKSLAISIVHQAENSEDHNFEMSVEQTSEVYSHLRLEQPATFESCSTLLSIHAYFKDSDEEYVCVTRQGIFLAVLNRAILTNWSLSI